MSLYGIYIEPEAINDVVDPVRPICILYNYIMELSVSATPQTPCGMRVLYTADSPHQKVQGTHG